MVAVAKAPDTAAQPAQVSINVLDQAKTAAVGGVGAAFTMVRADAGLASSAARVVVDYSQWRHLSGANFGSRLRLVALPGCSLDAAPAAGCLVSSDLGAVNDVVKGTLTATVPVGGDPQARSVQTADGKPPAPSASPSVMVVQASQQSQAGQLGVPPVAGSGHWAAGAQAGDFSYAYPFKAPPSVATAAPDVSLQYSSQSVDGRTQTRNNQASIVGMGWEMQPGFIARATTSCKEQTSLAAMQTYNDQCWTDPVAASAKESPLTLTLNGQSGRLFKDEHGEYKLENDPGWRIQNVGTGDTYWVVTTSDGTKYFFGRTINAPSGTKTTESTLHVPTFATRSGECGYVASGGYCDLPYQWNLDNIIDPHGKATYFYYYRETNKYTSKKTSTTLTYDRAAHVKWIDYGMHSGTPDAQVLARVLFPTKGRCVEQGEGGSGAACPALTTASGSSYPDVPVDQVCTAATCTSAQDGPSFFSAQMISQVDAQVWDGSALSTVDDYALSYYFPVPTNGATPSQYNNAGAMDPTLWLHQITHTGSDKWADTQAVSSVALPPTVFAPQMLRNRVDFNDANGVLRMDMPRIGEVETETGSRITPTYSSSIGGQCTSSSLPAQSSDNRLCFTQYVAPDAGAPGYAWYYKYVVTDVAVSDPVSSQPTQVTHYDYYGSSTSGVLWNYDHDVTHKIGHHAFSDWRGFPEVKIYQGSTSGKQTITDHRYFTGLDGEPTATDGTGSRSNRINGADGPTYTDTYTLAGYPVEESSYASGGTEMFHTVHTQTFTATNTLGAPAGFVRETRTDYQQGPVGTTGSRLVETDRTFDTSESSGQLLTEYEKGAVDSGHNPIDSPAVDRCTSYSYATNTDANHFMTSYVAQKTLRNGNCGATLSGRTDYIYDNGTTTSSPIVGDLTTTRVYTSGSTYNETNASYDNYGRTLTSTVATGVEYQGSTVTTGSTSTTSYAPSCPTTTTCPNPSSITTTAPAVSGHPANTTVQSSFDLGQGLVPKSVTDANNHQTRTVYDGLGRPTRLYTPTETGTTCPAQLASYTVSQTAPSNVRSRTLQTAGGTDRSCSGSVYLESYTYYDSMLRPVETQSQPPSGSGSIVSLTRYNDRGLMDSTTYPQSSANSLGAAESNLNPPYGNIPVQTVYDYDPVGRQGSVALYNNATLKWQTATAYAPTQVTTTPAVGSSVLVKTDGLGRTIETDSNDTLSSGAATTDVSKTVYDRNDTVLSTTDPAGNVTSSTYDWLSEPLDANDPDRGGTSIRYNTFGQPKNVTTGVVGGTSVTNLSYGYDTQLRRTAVVDNKVSGGPIIDSWNYDGAGQTGLLSSASNAHNSLGAITTAYSYDARNRVTAKALTIPSSVTGLAGTWTTSYGYDSANHPTTMSYPNAAGLPSNEVTTASYSNAGFPTTLTSNDGTALVASTSFYGDGNLSTRVYGNTSTTMTRTYTNEPVAKRLGNITTIKTVNGTSYGLQNDNYTYDPAGNITDLNDPGTYATPANHQCFTYDAKHLRLTRAYTASAACSGAPAYAAVGTNPYDVSYVYSGPSDVITSSSSAAGTRNYIYPGSGPGSVRPHAVGGTSGSASTSYSYDNAGRMISRNVGVTSTMTFSPTGQLDSLGSSNYLYDADGNRVVRIDSGARVLFLDGQQVIYAGSTTGNRFYNFGGSQFAVRQSNGTTSTLSWMGADSRNSQTVTVNSNGGGSSSRQDYKPYGEIRGSQVLPTDHGYLSQPLDSATGLIADGARFYDPGIGRFISPDPAHDGADAYGYAADNPIAYSDPSGLKYEYDICNGCGIPHGVTYTSGNEMSVRDFLPKAASLMGKTIVDTAAKVANDAIDLAALINPLYGLSSLASRIDDRLEIPTYHVPVPYKGRADQLSGGLAFGVEALAGGVEVKAGLGVKAGITTELGTAAEAAGGGGDHIALALTENVDEFATSVGARHVMGQAPGEWQTTISAAAHDGSTAFSVSLDGVEGLEGSITRGAYREMGARGVSIGGRSPSWFDWEMYTLDKAGAWGRTTFYRGGNVVPNPFG